MGAILDRWEGAQCGRHPNPGAALRTKLYGSGARMTTATANNKDLTPTREDFAAMLGETMPEDEVFEGSVVKGTVTAIEKDLAVIDVGLKMEGRVPLREFTAPGRASELKVGDTVEVYIERTENALGEAVL